MSKRRPNGQPVMDEGRKRTAAEAAARAERNRDEDAAEWAERDAVKAAAVEAELAGSGPEEDVGPQAALAADLGIQDYPETGQVLTLLGEARRFLDSMTAADAADRAHKTAALERIDSASLLLRRDGLGQATEPE